MTNEGPARLRGRSLFIGAPRFELGTSPTRTVRATRLRHAPESLGLSHRRCAGPAAAPVPFGAVGLEPLQVAQPAAHGVDLDLEDHPVELEGQQRVLEVALDARTQAADVDDL